MNGNTDRETLKSTMYRYMSQELAQELLKLEDGIRLRIGMELGQ